MKMKKGWCIVEIGEICKQIVNGSTPSTSIDDYWNGDIVWVTPKDLGKLKAESIDTSERKITKEGYNSANLTLVSAGSIILSTRAPIGYVAMAKTKLCFNQGCKALIPNETVDSNFLYYFLIRSKNILEELGSGAIFKELSTTNLSKIKLLLPPLEEQKRIVKIIDTKMKSVEVMKQVAQEQQRIAESLFLSYLQTMAVSAKYTTSTIGDFCTLMTGGTPSSTNRDYYENGDIPWLVSGDIHKETVFDCEQHITELGMMNSNAKILPKGSVLIALAGQGKTRGTVAMLEMDNATCNQSLVSITPNPDIAVSKYIYYNLRSRYNAIRALTGDMERSGLSITRIKKLKINLPNIDEQREIVLKIDTKSVAMNNIKKAINERLSYIDALLSSILRQAFNGEL